MTSRTRKLKRYWIHLFERHGMLISLRSLSFTLYLTTISQLRRLNRKDDCEWIGKTVGSRTKRYDIFCGNTQYVRRMARRTTNHRTLNTVFLVEKWTSDSFLSHTTLQRYSSPATSFSVVQLDVTTSSDLNYLAVSFKRPLFLSLSLFLHWILQFSVS
jgi:hypothetical protein